MATWPLIARIPLAFMLIAHGLAHLVGVRALWGMESIGEEGGFAEPALGWLAEGTAGVIHGAVWLLACAAFVVLGVLLLSGRTVLLSVAAASAFSLLLSLLVWPGAPIGVVLNLLLMVGAVAAWFFRGTR
ncbi:MAG: hypothetical protein Q4G67_05570 [Actinomycetia bacterium]|nr:hypothetical protein [Actinomycetes bacterium]